MADNAYLDIQAAWRRTIGHWWFLLAAFPSVVGEVVRFLVSVLLLVVAGDAYTGTSLFLPELSLSQLPPSGWPPGPWFWARVPEILSTYLLGVAARRPSASPAEAPPPPCGGHALDSVRLRGRESCDPGSHGVCLPV